MGVPVFASIREAHGQGMVTPGRFSQQRERGTGVGAYIV